LTKSAKNNRQCHGSTLYINFYSVNGKSADLNPNLTRFSTGSRNMATWRMRSWNLVNDLTYV